MPSKMRVGRPLGNCKAEDCNILGRKWPSAISYYLPLKLITLIFIYV